MATPPGRPRSDSVASERMTDSQEMVAKYHQSQDYHLHALHVAIRTKLQQPQILNLCHWNNADLGVTEKEIEKSTAKPGPGRLNLDYGLGAQGFFDAMSRLKDMALFGRPLPCRRCGGRITWNFVNYKCMGKDCEELFWNPPRAPFFVPPNLARILGDDVPINCMGRRYYMTDEFMDAQRLEQGSLWTIDEIDDAGIQRVGPSWEQEFYFLYQTDMMADSEGDFYIAPLFKLTSKDKEHSAEFICIELRRHYREQRWFFIKTWGHYQAQKERECVYEFETPQAAIEHFHSSFLRQTGNHWRDRKSFEKKEDKLEYAPPEQMPPITKSGLHPWVVDLFRWVFDEHRMKMLLGRIGINTRKMPRVALTGINMEVAAGCLERIRDAVDENDEDSHTELIEADQRLFYGILPYVNRLNLFDEESLDTMIERMRPLRELGIMNKIMMSCRYDYGVNPLDALRMKAGPDIKLRILDRAKDEYRQVKAFIEKSMPEDKARVMDVIGFEKRAETDPYQRHVANRTVLMHATSFSHFGTVLLSGLRFPQWGIRDPVYGPGLYFSDAFPVAFLNEDHERFALLMICEVALGTQLVIEDRREENWFEMMLAVRAQSVCVLSEQQRPLAEKDPLGYTVNANRVMSAFYKDYQPTYNEYVVYDPTQVKLKYIVKLDTDWEEDEDRAAAGLPPYLQVENQVPDRAEAFETDEESTSEEDEDDDEEDEDEDEDEEQTDEDEEESEEDAGAAVPDPSPKR